MTVRKIFITILLAVVVNTAAYAADIHTGGEAGGFETALWFQYSVFLLVAGLIYGLYSLRRYYITDRELLRLRIARDLHDDISSTLSSINFFADAIESKSLNKADSERFLKLISDSSREAKERISDIIWVIHPQDDDWDTLLLKCKRYASDILDCKNISHRFAVEGRPPVRLNLDLKKNTWFIFKELITNIAKHADPNLVEIRFTVEGGTIKLSVHDDGMGFDPNKQLNEGFGLRNIKGRVEGLKGDLFLDSRRNSGTHWKLRLPILE
jgi:signal transduction histidine kinase